MAKSMSPELAKMVVDFRAKHPSFDLSTGFNPFSPAAHSSDPQAIADFLKLRQALDNEDFHLTGGGNPEHDRAVWKQAVMVAATLAGPYVLGAALPSGAATGATATDIGGATATGEGAWGTEAATVPLGSLATAPAAIPPPVAPPPVTPPPIGGTSLWSKYVAPLLATAVPAVTNLAGTKLQVDANQKAADVAAKAAQDALDWQKSVYATRQKQLAIPIGVGNGATLELGNLLGIPAPAGGYQPDLPPEPAKALIPATATAPPATTTAPGATPQMVPMKAPDGTVKAVPPDQVSYFESKGATRVAA